MRNPRGSVPPVDAPRRDRYSYPPPQRFPSSLRLAPRRRRIPGVRLKNSYPLLRKVAKALGIYGPLHRLFIRYLLRNVGVSLASEADRKTLLLTKGDRRIRVKDWDTAAIASYSFDDMFGAVQSNGEKLVDYSQPAWHTMARTGERFYFTAIADLEVDEFFATYSVKVGPGGVVYHVGAYCGVQTVEFSRMVGSAGRVVAFEPDRESFRALEKNLAEHHAANVVAVNKGLWSSVTELRFFATEGMHSSFTNAPSHEKVECVLPVTTADAVASELQLTRMDLFKIDAEGAEFEILKGATQVLDTLSPAIFIDVHLHTDPQLDRKIDELLTGRGYRVRWLPQTTSSSMAFCYAEKP